MRRWWMSFWFAGDDYRPLACPPAADVLGYWASGHDMDGRASLCLLVRADSQEAARRAILADWPESAGCEFRFCDEKPADWLPGDRFPLTHWQLERLHGKGEGGSDL